MNSINGPVRDDVEDSAVEEVQRQSPVAQPTGAEGGVMIQADAGSTERLRCVPGPEPSPARTGMMWKLEALTELANSSVRGAIEGILSNQKP
jgi:hypothetical protein